jgi:hypothetical protein
VLGLGSRSRTSVNVRIRIFFIWELGEWFDWV